MNLSFIQFSVDEELFVHEGLVPFNGPGDVGHLHLKHLSNIFEDAEAEGYVFGEDSGLEVHCVLLSDFDARNLKGPVADVGPEHLQEAALIGDQVGVLGLDALVDGDD